MTPTLAGLRLDLPRRGRSLVLLAVGADMHAAVLAVTNALAAWPGRQAARLRSGHVLRAE